MKIINRYTGNTIAEGDNLLQIVQDNKANLRSANLRSANLRSADLRSADLYGADLRSAELYGANLSGANLRSANLYGAGLSGANLSGANLSGANLYGAEYGDNETLVKYLSIGPIGSRNDYLQVFVTDKQKIIKTGCFSGSVEEFRQAVNKRHDNNDHSRHYMLAINLIEEI